MLGKTLMWTMPIEVGRIFVESSSGPGRAAHRRLRPVMADAGVTACKIPLRSLRSNAHAERFVLSGGRRSDAHTLSIDRLGCKQ
jgi:hypothetical protein